MELRTTSLPCLEALSEDYDRLYRSGMYSDVVITDGSKEIPAHKFVLCARSPAFLKMLEPQMMEKQVWITTEGTSIEVLRELLHFMYTAKVNIKNSQMARDLYVTAGKWEVKELIPICMFRMKSWMSVKNVLETLLLADFYNEKALKIAALNFIANNYSQMKAQENWSTFKKEHQALANELLSFIIYKK